MIPHNLSWGNLSPRRLSTSLLFDGGNDDRKQDATLYLQRGLAYLQLPDLQQALADLNRTIEVDPQLAEGYLFRGIVNTGLGQHEKARADVA